MPVLFVTSCFGFCVPVTISLSVSVYVSLCLSASLSASVCPAFDVLQLAKKLSLDGKKSIDMSNVIPGMFTTAKVKEIMSNGVSVTFGDLAVW
jgi:hypothetical protein